MKGILWGGVQREMEGGSRRFCRARRHRRHPVSWAANAEPDLIAIISALLMLGDNGSIQLLAFANVPAIILACSPLYRPAHRRCQ